MFLFINTSQTDLIDLKLIKDNKIVDTLTSRENFKQSELLLSLIDKLAGNQLKKLTGIVVVKGPGAFSALRFGITTANALAWSLKIPVIGLSVIEAAGDERITKSLKLKTKNLTSKKFKPVVPKYGAEPNITKAKNKKL